MLVLENIAETRCSTVFFLHTYIKVYRNYIETGGVYTTLDNTPNTRVVLGSYKKRVESIPTFIL